MIVQLLSAGASRRTIMRQAGAYRLTVDSIANETHVRQINREKYADMDEKSATRCPCCGMSFVKLPCPVCSKIKFKGM